MGVGGGLLVRRKLSTINTPKAPVRISRADTKSGLKPLLFMTVSVAVDGERLVVQNRRGSGIHRGLEFYVALFATGCIGEVFVLTVAARDAAVRSCLGQRLFAGRHFVVASAATLNTCLGWITAIWTMHNQDLQDLKICGIFI